MLTLGQLARLTALETLSASPTEDFDGKEARRLVPISVSIQYGKGPGTS